MNPTSPYYQVNSSTGRCLSRRTLLRGAGVSMGIPFLSAMEPAFGIKQTEAPVPRFVAMTLGLGLVAENLNPGEAGRNYTPSLYLEPLEDLRDQYTVISGCSHPGVGGGHRAEASILTANPSGSSGRGKNTISVDQYLALHRGHETRFPSLVLSSAGSNSPSYTAHGSMVPAEDSPRALFNRLFIDESAAERRRQAQRVAEGRSILDLVGDDAQRLRRSLGKGDQHRMDQYYTGVRELEQRMARSEDWARRPKPHVNRPMPIDIGNSSDFIGRQRLMSEMVSLAVQTDSTRYITYHLGGSGGVVPVPGVDEGYHSLSHHGKSEEKLDQLALVEAEIIKAWGDFLRSLRDHSEQGRPLLEMTSVLLTSNLGNASSHDNRNMPVLFAGGGFRHGNHLAFDRKNNYALPKLYVSLMQSHGMPDEQFAGTSGTMTGLERA